MIESSYTQGLVKNKNKLLLRRKLRNFIKLEIPSWLHLVLLQKVKYEELPPSMLNNFLDY